MAVYTPVDVEEHHSDDISEEVRRPAPLYLSNEFMEIEDIPLEIATQANSTDAQQNSTEIVDNPPLSDSSDSALLLEPMN